MRYLTEKSLDRQPHTVDVPLRYTLDEAALDAWLAEVAASHDRPPQPPQPIVQTMSIAPGKPGQALDMEASRSQLLATLADPRNRTVNLAVAETPAPPIGIKALGDLLKARLDEFPGIASVYLHYLPTGEEIAINGDVAYAGTSTLKIPILEQVYRKLDAPPGVETTKIISETMMHSGNFTANLMLGNIGDGDWDVGVQRMNEAFKTLGMTNTFMATPYDRQMAVPPRIVTEANSRTDLNTQPDPYMQTTPRDIGMSLQMLVACSEGGGTLIAVYGDQITPAECQQALDFMSLNEMTEMLVGGLPAGRQGRPQTRLRARHARRRGRDLGAGRAVRALRLPLPPHLAGMGHLQPDHAGDRQDDLGFLRQVRRRAVARRRKHGEAKLSCSPCLCGSRFPWFALYASGAAGGFGRCGFGRRFGFDRSLIGRCGLRLQLLHQLAHLSVQDIQPADDALADILRHGTRAHVDRDLLGLHAQILGSLALAGLVERHGHLIAELLQPVENFGLQLPAILALPGGLDRIRHLFAQLAQLLGDGAPFDFRFLGHGCLLMQ